MATRKQKKAIKILAESGGSVRSAMRKAGYSAVSANTPKKLTKSKAWAELVDDELNDDLLLKVHREGLRATKKFQEIVDRDSKGAPIYGLIDVDDHPTRHKYLESAYKLRNKTPESMTNNGVVVNNVIVFSNNDPLSKQYGNNSAVPVDSREAPTTDIQQPSQIQGDRVASQSTQDNTGNQ